MDFLNFDLLSAFLGGATVVAFKRISIVLAKFIILMSAIITFCAFVRKHMSKIWKVCLVLFIMLSIVALTSCSSNHAIVSKIDVTGSVIDEKNEVNELYCDESLRDYRADIKSFLKCSFTNSVLGLPVLDSDICKESKLKATKTRLTYDLCVSKKAKTTVILNPFNRLRDQY